MKTLKWKCYLGRINEKNSILNAKPKNEIGFNIGATWHDLA